MHDHVWGSGYNCDFIGLFVGASWTYLSHDTQTCYLQNDVSQYDILKIGKSPYSLMEPDPWKCHIDNARENHRRMDQESGNQTKSVRSQQKSKILLHLFWFILSRLFPLVFLTDSVIYILISPLENMPFEPGFSC